MFNELKKEDENLSIMVSIKQIKILVSTILNTRINIEETTTNMKSIVEKTQLKITQESCSNYIKEYFSTNKYLTIEKLQKDNRKMLTAYLQVNYSVNNKLSLTSEDILKIVKAWINEVERKEIGLRASDVKINHYESDSDTEDSEDFSKFKKKKQSNNNEIEKKYDLRKNISYSPEDDIKIRRLNSLARLLSITSTPAVAVCIIHENLIIGTTSAPDQEKIKKNIYPLHFKMRTQANAKFESCL
jgi:hypothetical protein